MYANNKPLLLTLLVFAVLFIGQIISPKPLTLDECALTINIMERDFAGLTEPLRMMQVAPIGFLFLNKAIGGALHYGDFGMVLISLIALGLTYYFIMKTLVNYGIDPLYGLIGIFLFKAVLLYGFQVKQYIIDCLALAYIFYLDSKKNKNNTTTIDFKEFLFFSILITMSNIALVYVSIYLLYLGIQHLYKPGKKSISSLAYSGLIAVFVLAYYFRFVYHHPHSATMMKMWRYHFFPLQNTKDATMAYFFKSHFLGFISFNFVTVPIPSLASALYVFYIIAISVIFILFLFYFRSQKRTIIILLAPFIIAFILSLLKIYPLDNGRLSLYLAVPTILIIAKVLAHKPGYVKLPQSVLRNGLVAAFCGLYLFTFFNEVVINPVQPYRGIVEKTNDKDVLMAIGSAGKHFLRYQTQYKINNKPFPEGKILSDFDKRILDSLRAAAPGRRLVISGAHKSTLFDKYATRADWCQLIGCTPGHHLDEEYYFDRNRAIWYSFFR